MKTRQRHNRPWTARELKVLRERAARGRSSREAAVTLRRSPGAVKYKAMVEGVAFNAIRQPKGVQMKLAARRRKFGMRATLRQAA